MIGTCEILDRNKKKGSRVEGGKRSSSVYKHNKQIRYTEKDNKKIRGLRVFSH